tara:strand:- start:84 stop:293 length:210 start_codon:yes stop_codon:yes gene_type:complete
MFNKLDSDDVRMKIISVILGLGFASFFRKVCNKESCKIIRGPDLNTVRKNMYKIDDKCYTYKPIATLCD